MGNLILCHDRHAAHPYEITRIHSRIFTIEELCYYLCNNLYLIDYTIMNEQLCDWLDEELGMEALASELRDMLRLRGSVEKFVLTILKASKIYREPEMIRIQNVLEHLKNQKDVERQKFKGDNLLESGELEEAILVYQAILNDEKDETPTYRLLSAAFPHPFSALPLPDSCHFLLSETFSYFFANISLYSSTDTTDFPVFPETKKRGRCLSFSFFSCIHSGRCIF